MWGVEGHTAFCARIGDGDLDGPALPADLVVAAHGVPCLAAALLEELDRDLAATAAAARVGRCSTGTGVAEAETVSQAAAVRGWVVGLVALGFELAHEGGDALVDEGLDLGLGDVGEFKSEDIAGLRDDGREVAEEEDGVEDAWAEKKQDSVSFGGVLARGHEIGLVSRGSGQQSRTAFGAETHHGRCRAPNSGRQRPRV